MVHWNGQLWLPAILQYRSNWNSARPWSCRRHKIQDWGMRTASWSRIDQFDKTSAPPASGHLKGQLQRAETHRRSSSNEYEDTNKSLRPALFRRQRGARYRPFRRPAANPEVRNHDASARAVQILGFCERFGFTSAAKPAQARRSYPRAAQWTARDPRLATVFVSTHRRSSTSVCIGGPRGRSRTARGPDRPRSLHLSKSVTSPVISEHPTTRRKTPAPSAATSPTRWWCG